MISKSSETCFFPGHGEPSWVLGKPFMLQYCVKFNAGRKRLDSERHNFL